MKRELPRISIMLLGPQRDAYAHNFSDWLLKLFIAIDKLPLKLKRFLENDK